MSLGSSLFTRCGHVLLVGSLLTLAACPRNGPGTGTPGTPPAPTPSSAIQPATGQPEEPTPEVLEDREILYNRNNAAIAEEWRGKSFEEFEATVYRDPSGKYIVDGDTPIVDRKHLMEFFETKVQRATPFRAGLAVMTVGGVDAVWDEVQKRNLTYCVSDTFGSRHSQVVTAMASAAGAWAAVADIRFIHSAAQDGGCTATNGQVVFDVRPVSNQPYLARAFFPGDARWERNVLIDASSFNLTPGGKLTLTGILRHELGHTLGFRHEHTRPEAGTCFEDNNWRPLTSYDDLSTMHYPQCNGGGDWSLTLTAMDESGAACLYGPASGFTIDPSICTPPTVPPGDPCAPTVVTKSGQVSQGEQDNYGPFSVRPGSQFVVEMSGDGDPDLYVRFRQAPTVGAGGFDCRPYLSGASERCDLTVPTGAATAFVMIRGFEAGTYNLTIEHTPSP